MGSPISPIVANLYMDNFEVEAINTAPHPPYLWKRYVDDTLTIIKSSQIREFLDHINSIDKTYSLQVKTKEKMDPCPS